jgi:hypothetical protein
MITLPRKKLQISILSCRALYYVFPGEEISLSSIIDTIQKAEDQWGIVTKQRGAPAPLALIIKF